MGIFQKILTWLRVNGASILGLSQGVLKMVKEILTAVINFLSLIAPAAKAQAVVVKVRDIVNSIDAWIESIKGKILGNLVPVAPTATVTTSSTPQ